MFMEAQGYEIGSNIIFQDNKSAILLARNGRNSCAGNSRHVAVRYLFVKDRVDKDEVRVEYLPTGSILRIFIRNHCKANNLNFSNNMLWGGNLCLNFYFNMRMVRQLRRVLKIVINIL